MKKNKKKPVLTGTFTGNARGFGFVRPDTPTDGAAKASPESDIFIPPDDTGDALNGDTVVYHLTPEYLTYDFRRREGEIIEVIRRGSTTQTGTFHLERGMGYVVPLDKKIPYCFCVTKATRKRWSLVDGHQVVFQTPPCKSALTGAYVEILEVLGHKDEPGVDILSIAAQHGVPREFPQAVLTEAEALPEEIKEEDLTQRLDLRDVEIITIDGEDTKDIDDAIHLRKTPEGFYELGVHIADVSHYVGEGTALDEEALRRGTSVYPAGRVIPMLPQRLSNGICSLQEEEDRLALSCIMIMDGEGRVTTHRITPSVIRSRKKFTYERVQALLNQYERQNSAEEAAAGNGEPETYAETKDSEPETYAAAGDDAGFVPMLLQMNQLKRLLRRKRMARGALEFNFPEAKIQVDEKGRPIFIAPSEHNDATGIIEECMILCNETVAAYFFSSKAPFVYRTHEEPQAEKIQQLAAYVGEMGYRLRGSGKASSALRDLLTRSEGTPEETVIGQAILRSMQQARYTPDNPYHFGLAAPFYCHFTSPIRRYPDLLIHRLIKQLLSGMDAEQMKLYRQALPELCADCSRTERAAEAVEREVAQLKKVQYMQGKEGREFEGVVTGIMPWGIYVGLPDTVEGLIPLARIKQKTPHNPIKPGDRVSVRLREVSEEERKIWFDLI